MDPGVEDSWNYFRHTSAAPRRVGLGLVVVRPASGCATIEMMTHTLLLLLGVVALLLEVELGLEGEGGGAGICRWRL